MINMMIKKSKYGNKKVVHEGIKFDSIAEMEFYKYITSNKDSKGISSIELQPSFSLLDKFTKEGKTYRGINYRADFKLTYNDNRIEIIDVKGMQTEVFKLKRKLFESKYDFKLILIKYGKKKGFEVLK